MNVPHSEPELLSSGSLAARQRERLPLATQRAEHKLRSIQQDDTARDLLRASTRARTAMQRVVWLQRAASAWAGPLEKVGACRSGCAHCCHIPVTISRIEAERLGKAVGCAPARPANWVLLDALDREEQVLAAQAQLQADAARSPCPFLENDRCSVYEHRPIACRTLVNLDDDDLLCRHADDAPPASVPYADARMIKALALAAQAGSEFADIRAFFAGQGSAA